MKRLGAIIIMAASFAVAIDFAQVESAQIYLLGALREAISDSTVEPQIIPGHGLHMTVMARISDQWFAGSDEIRRAFEEARVADHRIIEDILIQLAPGIRGLETGQYVSIHHRRQAYGSIPGFTIFARIKHDEPDSLELWVDGVRQE